MRIAQVAPLIESVPPQGYGGTERIVSYITEDLVQIGHDVTLFASADSETSARLVPCCPTALRHDATVKDHIPHYVLMLDRVRRMAKEFDVIHFHVDALHFPLFRGHGRILTTLHGRQDDHDLQQLYRGFPDMPLVSISSAQRTPIPGANFLGTVYHGLPLDLHRPTLAPRGGYLAFLGRISPEKGIERAVAIARAVGMPLKVAAKVDRKEVDYYKSIEPLLKGDGVEFVGEIDEARKTSFLGEAAALLFPIDWPEPFGLVMIEAMACGTPVLAFRRGSVPEVIEVGLTGAVVDTVDEAIADLPSVLKLDRARVRRRFEERFTARRMTLDYLMHYAALIERDRRRLVAVRTGADRMLPQVAVVGT